MIRSIEEVENLAWTRIIALHDDLAIRSSLVDYPRVISVGSWL